MAKQIVTGLIAGAIAVIAVMLTRPATVPPAQSQFAAVNQIVTPGLPPIARPTTLPAIDYTDTALDIMIDEVNFESVPFAKFVDWLRKATNANINPNWRALEAAGIARDTPLSVQGHKLTARKILRMALEDVGGTNVRLAHWSRDNVITISTEDDSARDVLTLIYDIRDLVTEPWLGVAPASADFSTNSQGAPKPSTLQQQVEEPMSVQERGDCIVRMIEETCDPVSWRDAGGSSGGIRFFNGRLIVTQTWENHRFIAQFLAQLRGTKEEPKK